LKDDLPVAERYWKGGRARRQPRSWRPPDDWAYGLLTLLILAIFIAAVAAWVYGVWSIIDGHTMRGLAIGVPAAWVILVFAWIKVGSAFWVPDGGGGPGP
jgi:hypothetical protein